MYPATKGPLAAANGGTRAHDLDFHRHFGVHVPLSPIPNCDCPMVVEGMPE